MAVKQTIRRLLFGNTPGDKLDQTPIELPVGHHNARKSAAQEIQEQIAIQIALKQATSGAPHLQTIGEIEAELADLDPDENTAFYEQHSYLDMPDIYEPEPFHPTAEIAPTESEGGSEQASETPQAEG
jgi:hypothetical protein